MKNPLTRCERLSYIAHDAHANLDQLVASLNPFTDRERYGRFVRAQYLFQLDAQPLYQDVMVSAMINDLPERCRVRAACADLIDLGLDPPAMLPGGPDRDDYLLGMGWLYVSEGSKLGAAVILKQVAALGLDEHFGGRHLAAPEQGRTASWKRFKLCLDSLSLEADDENRLDAGVIAAFQRFGALLAHCFPGKVPSGSAIA